MKIIDINCTFGTLIKKGKKFTKSSDLLLEMDKYRISSCIAFSSLYVWQPMLGNENVKDIAEASRGRIKACYVLEPNLGTTEMPGRDELARKLEVDRPAAVKLYPRSNNYVLDGFYCGELLELLNRYEMPVFLDSNEAPDYKDIPGLAMAYPNIKFVILRTSIKKSRNTIPLLSKLENVYFDMSVMIDTGLIEEIVDRFGSEKLLFGSGMPFYVPAGALSMIIYSRIDKKHRENILFRNWERIEGGIRYDNK